MAKKISDELKARILELYEECNGSRAETIRRLKSSGTPVSETPIKKIWKEAGFKSNPRGGRRVALNGGRGALADDEIAEIVDAYDTYDGNLGKAINGLKKYSGLTIKTYWEKAGFKIDETDNRKLRDDEIAEIVDAYPEYNGVIAHAVKGLRKYSSSTIRKYWIEAGCEINPRGGTVPENDHAWKKKWKF
jgi:hypothetical protein